MKLQLHNITLVSPNGKVCSCSVKGSTYSKIVFKENNLKFDFEKLVINDDFSQSEKNSFINDELFTAGRWAVEISK